ncbi:nucleoside 2-deoxyribosyltransferase [Salicola sp. Rm-C-2C1-2]|uniref:nucleoside 2-deoxyribosyltransferase n=1 Tax=Salicola sp. Rm-C-2C1-2 TaxID=3141321 RepID=UPI0032E46FC0
MASIYLAGPDVFFPDTIRNPIEATKKAILAEHGLEALSPCDNDLDLDTASSPAQLIYDANRNLMNQADGLIANLTPFRGPSADAGTIFEVGYMIAQNKLVAAYTTCTTPYNQRVSCGADTDANGSLVEGFGLCDNLMLDCGIEASGGVFVSGSLEWRSEGFTPEESFDEDLFRKAAEVLSKHF